VNAPVRVLIADDHAPTRTDLRRLLDGDERFALCAEAEDAPAAVAAAVAEKPELCLLDIGMPGSGVAAAWEISACLPLTKIVMLTVSRDDRDLFASLRAGASGYLLKDLAPSRLLDALADVVHGEAALPPALVARLIDEFRTRQPRRREIIGDGLEAALTSREWQVLDLLRLELSTAEIARRLSVSRPTVRSHVAAILRKLRVPDRAAAVRLFTSVEAA
jgi:DNA-binding NarL/FixJ family response regulator